MPEIAKEVERLLSTAEVAQELGLAPQTVLALARSGLLRSVRCGRLYRYRRAWVEDFIDGRRAQ